MGKTDQQIRDAIDAVYAKFETKEDNSILSSDVYNLVTSAMSQLGEAVEISASQVS